MRLLVGVVALLVLAQDAAAQSGDGPCLGDYMASAVEQRPGPALRFGITPSGAAGQIGPVPSTFRPDQPDRILEALAQLRPAGRPFVTHAYTHWGEAGEAEDRRLLELAERYTGNGYLFEVVIRFKPPPGHERDVAGYTDFVRHIVRLLGPNRGVVSFQITNEVNFTASPDSSDGFYEGAREALIQGVIAGKDEARRHGYDQLEIGFNWLYRTDTANERSFWEYIRDRGGPAFVDALDWVGLDAYPGTFFPPETPPGGERDFIVNALSLLRCYATSARIPATVPIHVQENGYPTGDGSRTYERQAQAMRTMVRAFHDYRGTFNVTDYRWFNLRDAETASPNFQQHYGIMRDDYTPKPAFGVFRETIGELSVQDAPPVVGGSASQPGLRLRLSARRATRGRCRARTVLVTVGGRDHRRVRHVEFLLGRRRAATDGRRPFRRRLRVRRARGRIVLRARVVTSDGRRVTLRRRLRPCRGHRG